MILRHEQRIFEAASREPGRYAMHGVRLRLLDGKPVLEATDGRILVRVEVELEEGEELAFLPEEGVILRGDDLRDAWPAAKAGRKGLFLRRDEGEWFLDCGGSRTRLGTIDGEFPRVDALVALIGQEGTLGFDLDLLNRLAKAAGASYVRFEMPKLEGGQVRGPVGVRFSRDDGTFTVPLDNFRGVIMPMTVG